MGGEYTSKVKGGNSKPATFHNKNAHLSRGRLVVVPPSRAEPLGALLQLQPGARRRRSIVLIVVAHNAVCKVKDLEAALREVWQHIAEGQVTTSDNFGGATRKVRVEDTGHVGTKKWLEKAINSTYEKYSKVAKELYTLNELDKI